MLSVTLDDAAESQLDVALPVLDAHAVKASFYVLPARVRRRAAEWRAVAGGGHELGCHTSTHPCSGNFTFSRRNALENYTLERIEAEMDRASGRIESLTGVRPRTFAYPCGQSFVGRGEGRLSYTPSVARRFVAARGFHNQVANDPEHCDLLHLDAFSIDAMAPDEVVDLVDGDGATGRWVIVGGHEVGRGGELTVRVDALEALCRRATAGDVWVAPVAEVAEHLQAPER